jgi:hypothetical protein
MHCGVVQQTIMILIKFEPTDLCHPTSAAKSAMSAFASTSGTPTTLHALKNQTSLHDTILLSLLSIRLGRFSWLGQSAAADMQSWQLSTWWRLDDYAVFDHFFRYCGSAGIVC